MARLHLVAALLLLAGGLRMRDLRAVSCILGLCALMRNVIVRTCSCCRHPTVRELSKLMLASRNRGAGHGGLHDKLCVQLNV